MRDMERKFKRDIEDILGTFAKNVGFLDIDICGPSQPRVLGTAEEKVHSSGAGWSPVYVSDNLAVMSVGFLLNSADDAVIWKGPKKDGSGSAGLNIPIIGLVENMTTFVCPKCKTKTAVFPATTGICRWTPGWPRHVMKAPTFRHEPDAAVTQAYKDIANKIKEYCDAVPRSHLTCSGSSSSSSSHHHTNQHIL
ncbi:hypothetical protein O3P69_012650 [Scylla paramamosain]|uniref:Uncharacterized protein n=1 Tax=Scylla paramamosain TaxID=85552 RepID=A0AAW0SFD2_SCYPA